MSEETPAGVPGGSGGNGQYIAIAVIFLLLGGGLLIFKMKGDDKPPPPAVPSATATTVAKPALTDAPPAPVEEDAGTPAPDASAGPKVAAVGGGPCSTTCSGSASGALTSEVQGVAGRARGCYERALRQNAQLSGKIVVALKVDQNGNVCGASASSDTMGSGDVTSCVTGMFRGKKFSPPTGGCVNMSVPLNFTPKK